LIDDPVIARLVAANPVAAPSPLIASRLGRGRPRHRLLAAALAAAAISVPAAAFAGDIGGLLGFSAHGQPVATSTTPFAHISGLNEALRELNFPATLQLLDRRDGISFYAARRPDGILCFAVDSDTGKGVGCDLGSPAGAIFPSPERPIIDFSRFSNGARLAGFAADGVATVALLDAAGATLASAPVVDNVYADANPPAGAVGVEALDTHGTVVYRRDFGQTP
jgi:hypothetical protein